jgi:hypothetical protein
MLPESNRELLKFVGVFSGGGVVALFIAMDMKKKKTQ